jgi:AraC family transcriptional regulator of adaptative response / DNA-3-methyladenine glycosylase II
MNDDVCYSALQSRDARFDGSFFVGVTSTKIYCRPICKVRIPKRENCRFFTHAAVAEGLGFRACLRCRPSLAPTDAVVRWTNEDASKTLAQQALQLVARSGGELSVVQVAAKMGISDRHLRRIFAAEWGLTPQAYLKAQLARKPHGDWLAKPLLLQLPLHLPYDHAHMLKFFATRAIEGVEHVDEKQRLWRSIRIPVKRKNHAGWICADLSSIVLQAKRSKTSASSDSTSLLPVTISASLVPVLAQLVPILRAAFDLDAQPNAIDSLLLPDFPNSAGQRVPGCFDGFELTVRAILGQQITVQAAGTLALRLVTRFGEPLKKSARTELVEVSVNRTFPSAAVLALATANDLGELGIVKQRQAAILGLAQAVQNGLDLSSKPRTPTELEAARDGLRAIKGIGEWTVAYVAMRALRDPDSFPAGDVALQKALGISIQDRQASSTKSAKDAEAQSAKWQPWRSYAVLRAWQRLEK